MSYTPCDYMDDVNAALGVSLDTEDVTEVANAALAEISRLKALDTSSGLESEHGGTWEEHEKFPPADWRMDVSNGDTRLGYWAWVVSQIEATEDDVPDAPLGSIDHMPDRNSDKERID